MLDSINIGTSGLVGFSKQLQTISNNVANLNTAGFKGSTTQFTSHFPERDAGTMTGQNGNQTGSGLGTLGSVVDFGQGQINQTGKDLDLAISGSGFFVLADAAGQSLYTRSGQLSFNDHGVLVNASGARVQALDTNGTLQDITLNDKRTSAAQATSAITLKGNLSTALADVPVGGVSVIDSAGGVHALSVNFHNNTGQNPGEWLVTVMDGATLVGSGAVSFTAGTLNAAQSSLSFTYAPANTTAMSLTLSLDSGTTSPSTGAANLTVSSIDGFGTGQLTRSTFDAAGRLAITYSNGQTVKSQSLALATFATTSDLQAYEGNAFSTQNPQGVTLNVATSGVTSITAGAVEGSNVDLTTQFSAIIVTQRGYQAASELISTANQMLDTLLHMKG